MKKRVFICAVIFFIFVNCVKANNGTKDNEHVEKNGVSFVSLPTDFFRSVAPGNWASMSTWESSNDSSTWIPATLVPGAMAAHVVIQSPDSVYLAANTSTTNLTILSGAKMNASIFTMTVSLRFNLLGTAFFYQGGTVLPVPGTIQVLDPASTYVYNGTQVGLNAAYPEFGNLLFAPSPSGPGTFENTIAAAPFFNGLVIRGNLTINLQQTRDISFATGSAVSRTHTIDGDLDIVNGNSIVSIQRGAAGSSTTGTVNIAGDLNFNGGTFLALGFDASNDGNAVLNLMGSINNSGGLMSTGTTSTGLFTLNFIGTAPQIFNSTGTILTTDRQNVNIDNSAGIKFNTPVVLKGNLNFVNGILQTTDVNLLTMGAGSTVTGVSNNSFVDGPVKKIGNTAFTFPVGKTGFGYVPIGISTFFGGTVNDEFTAEYIRGSARQLGPVSAGPGLARVSGCDYWILDKGLSTPASLDVTAYWSLNNTCIGVYVDNPNTLTVAHFNGGSWDSYSINPVVTGGSNSTAGSITWPGAANFSPFSLGSLTFGDNPLPVTINYFNGTKQNSNHLLNWKVTCNSTPSVNMVLELSTDGIHYNSIYSIDATALRCQQPFSYTDDKPAKGTNYYRIKMTDADGKITYSSLVSLINAARGIEMMNIAPNPVVNRTFNLKISAAEKVQVQLLVTDLQGRVIQEQSVSLIAGFNSIPMNVKNLAVGTYQLFGNTADGRTRVLRFVVQ